MSHSFMLMSMVLVLVTATALALPYPQDGPAEEVLAVDDTLPPLDETVDARHHYSSNNRRPAAYYNRPSYTQPAYHRPAAYNNRPASAAYNGRPQNYGSAAGHRNTAGGYNSGYGGSAGHQTNNFQHGSNSGYPSNHGSFGGLGWRQAQKPSGDDAAPSVDEPLVAGVDEGVDGLVVFQP